MKFDSLKKAFQNVTSTTAKKTGEQVQITKLALEKTKLEKEIEKTYAQIGRRVCELGDNGTLADDAIVEAVAAVKELKNNIVTIDDEINLHKVERDNAQYQLRFDEDGDSDEGYEPGLDIDVYIEKDKPEENSAETPEEAKEPEGKPAEKEAEAPEAAEEPENEPAGENEPTETAEEEKPEE